MNPNKHLRCAADELNKIRPAPSGTYELIVSDARIVVRPYSKSQKLMPLLARLNSTDVNQGPTATEWNRIETKIRRFVKKGFLT